GVWAQLRLVETGGGLRAPGDTVLLSCRGYGFKFEDYHIWWYRHEPGGKPDLVASITYWGTTDYGPAVQGRATVSRNNLQSESSLSLRALHSRDSARYFCAVLTE
ncbi:HV01 protein, partial [Alopecoenas beccarii]|nr:HV01 protein [Alopecoenas beccarii]